MPAATFTSRSLVSGDEVPSSNSRKLLLHPLLDEQQFTMFTNLEERVLSQQVPLLEVDENKNGWLNPSRACHFEREVFHKVPLSNATKLGLLCAGLKHWGTRRKVHYIGRHQETPFTSAGDAALFTTKYAKNERSTNRLTKATARSRKRKKARRGSEDVRGSSCSLKHRWSKKRYDAAELKLMEVVREKGAVLGKPILRPVLRSEARKYVSDTGLLDHLLKHMAGKVDEERGERLCRRHNADGIMEYWLESADLAERRRQAGVKDPCWVPPAWWKPGDNPFCNTETEKELKQLKEGMCNVTKYLEQLLLEEHGGEVDNIPSFIPKSATGWDSSNSVMVLMMSSRCRASKNLKERLSQDSYEWTEQKLQSSAEEKTFQGNLSSGFVLSGEEQKPGSDLGLIDQLLNHTSGKIDMKNGVCLCKCSNTDGSMKYWFDDINLAELKATEVAEEQSSAKCHTLEHAGQSACRLKLLVSGMINVKRYLELLLQIPENAVHGNLISVEGSQVHQESTGSLEITCSNNCLNYSRWSKERYAWAEQKLMDVMREKQAVLGNPILRPNLRMEARKHIGDTGLLDHLLKHMTGKVDVERGLRFCRCHNADGAMEYWLENADLVEFRRRAGVKDPYWVPPLGWRPGDDPYQNSTTSWELNHFKEEIANMHKHLEQLLSKWHESHSGDIASNLSLGHHSILESEGSVELRRMHQCRNKLEGIWSQETCECMKEKLISIFRGNGGALRNIPGSLLKSGMQKHMPEGLLVEHFLKHIVEKVDEKKGERPSQECSSEGDMDFWPERSEMVELQIEDDVSLRQPMLLEPGICPFYDLECTRNLKQLREECGNMKRYVAHLLLEKGEVKDRTKDISWSRCFHIDNEAVSSLKDFTMEEDMNVSTVKHTYQQPEACHPVGIARVVELEFS